MKNPSTLLLSVDVLPKLSDDHDTKIDGFVIQHGISFPHNVDKKHKSFKYKDLNQAP